MRPFRKFDYPKIAIFFVIIVGLNIGAFRFMPAFQNLDAETVMGATLYYEDFNDLESISNNYKKPGDEYIERFLRPSGAKALDKEYEYIEEGEVDKMTFSAPNEVVKAYFDILSDASNMGDKKGGCGSIGLGMNPYPTAYSLLSQGMKEAMHYETFLESFEGIGHINLIKMIEIRGISHEGRAAPRFFVEIETIEGSDTAGKTYFAYYYGYVTALQQGEDGWKIAAIELTPEDFLCHAYHGWWHDARTIVEIYYINNQKYADKIIDTEQNGDFTNVIARGTDGKEYRFTFVRLTNGADILIRQAVLEDCKWKDATIDMPKSERQR